MKRRAKAGIEVVCCECGFSDRGTPSSPAAPMLTALEDLRKSKGLAFSVGFMAMMSGNYQPVCPGCMASHTEVLGGAANGPDSSRA